MPLTVNEARASFTLHGEDFTPVKDPDWEAAAPDQRRAYWDQLGRQAFEAKLRELARGVDIHGRKLQRVKLRSRPKHLRQSGRLRPPLSPHEADSRFQRLLDFKAGAFGVTIFWRAGWSKIVGYHAEGGKYLPIRNVLGLTAASLARVKVRARQWWRHQRETAKPVGLDLERFTLMPGDRRRIEGADFFTGFRRRPTIGMPVPPPPPPRPKPGEPILPGRPIAERLKAYKEGDRKLKAILKVEADIERRLAKFNQIGEDINDLFNSSRDAGTFNDPEVQVRLAVMASQHEKAWDRFKAARDNRRQSVIKAIKPPVTAGWTAPATGSGSIGSLNPGQQGPAREGMEFVNAVLAPTDRKQVVNWEQIAAGRDQRAGAANDRIFLGDQDGATTAVHELGHIIDFNTAGASEVTREFLAYRAGGETPQFFDQKWPGQGFGASERGVKDDFDRFFNERSAYYAGKDYGRTGRLNPQGYYVGGTEITSMGLQALYDDPVGFARKDPEFCKFILGILDGSLR